MVRLNTVSPNASRLAISVVGIGLLAATGCSGGARVDQLEQSIRTLKNEITDIRGLQAQQNTTLNEMRSELRGLTGKVDEVAHVSVGKTQELEQTITRLQSRVPPPAGVPEELLNQDEERIAPLAGAGADSYRQALAQIRTGDFAGARSALTTFTEQNPGTAFTDNALFWLGIVSDRLGQSDRAIVAFSEVFQKYPAEDMVPASLYYLAESFVKMGSKSDAVLTLQKLADEHPKSPFAEKAREKLSELQPPAGRRRK